MNPFKDITTEDFLADEPIPGFWPNKNRSEYEEFIRLLWKRLEDSLEMSDDEGEHYVFDYGMMLVESFRIDSQVVIAAIGYLGDAVTKHVEIKLGENQTESIKILDLLAGELRPRSAQEKVLNIRILLRFALHASCSLKITIETTEQISAYLSEEYRIPIKEVNETMRYFLVQLAILRKDRYGYTS